MSLEIIVHASAVHCTEGSPRHLHLVSNRYLGIRFDSDGGLVSDGGLSGRTSQLASCAGLFQRLVDHPLNDRRHEIRRPLA